MQDIQSRIWRRFLLRTTATFAQLHEAIQEPEDSGGPPGYARMVHFVETGEDLYGDDPEELAAWLGGWRPDAFDLATAKAKFDR